MKILIIPDVHGRTFWRKAIEVINNYDFIVFLGDYLDPYSYEGITKEQAIEEFNDIIKFKKDNMYKVILLLGNHDCSYLFDFGSASRYDYKNSDKIKSIFKENKELFTLWYQIDKYLFT
ncbi:metallophosphoesterase, partial [Intestinibacter sp.]|uniref:metallophosphoesterase n=1 Tax=Intestinibacter sp. TaxID=1965304 RepID=UPI003F17F408